MIFFLFALQNCISTFLEFQTANSLEVIDSKDFLMPEFTVCLDEVMDADLLNKYGYPTSVDYIVGPWQGNLEVFG